MQLKLHFNAEKDLKIRRVSFELPWSKEEIRFLKNLKLLLHTKGGRSSKIIASLFVFYKENYITN